MEDEDEDTNPHRRFERSTNEPERKGLASLLVAHVFERNRINSYDESSTPSSVVTPDDDETERGGTETNLETPLVGEEGSVAASVMTVSTTSTRLNHATAALTNTIVGAGIVALPRVFESLGVAIGAVLLAGFFYLSRYTLAAMIRSANAVGVWTYDELVRSQFGDWGARSLDAAIVVNNLGGLLVYFIIMGDVLVGTSPFYSGIVTNALGMHGGDVWWVSREFVVAVVSLLVLFPLVSMRDISGLGELSVYSVSVAVGLVGSIVMLAVVAASQGKLATDVSVWLPDFTALGDSPARMAVSAVAILPVISVTFCCHYNLFPVATNLERFSDRRIAMVIRRSLAVCTALFLSLAISGAALFGSATEGNVLVNLRPEVVAAYTPRAVANILCLGIRILYLLVVLSSFPMLNWALRETASSYLFGARTLEGEREFLLFSFGLVLVEYVMSVVFPEIWTIMALTGATAAVYVMFILPGALIFKTSERGEDWFMSRFSIILGLVMMLFGVIDNV